MNIAIFVSGNGTNCENIIRHFQSLNGDTTVKLVLSNKSQAYALIRAQRLGVETAVLSKADINTEGVIMPLLQRYSIDFIVLAGFMLMIPSFLIDHYEHRMVNIHPSLLPKFGGKGMYGRHVHEEVKAAGERETGITIHYVSHVCDGGEIIAQFKTSIAATDSVDDIEAKVHALEQQHYPSVIEQAIVFPATH